MGNFIQVRTVTEEELSHLQGGLRHSESFVVRRCQIILLSRRGKTPKKIARDIGCSDQHVRDIIKAFNEGGIRCLRRQSTRPKTVEPLIRGDKLYQLEEILHQSPRLYGKANSNWTLNLAAEVCYEQGVTPYRVTDETIRKAIRRLGKTWKRAKRWITSPDPAYLRKKAARDRLIRLSKSHKEWVLGFLDQTWWSRITQTLGYTWCHPDSEKLRMECLRFPKDDPDPKALSCYGLWLPELDDLWLRFVIGRPVSAVTIDFLDWTTLRLTQMEKEALLLVWDNATWHKSHLVTDWIRNHNLSVRSSRQGVRIISCLLPVKSPWLNPIEPKWLHAKRAISEPDRILSPDEIKERVCSYFGCEMFDPLIQPKSK